MANQMYGGGVYNNIQPTHGGPGYNNNNNNNNNNNTDPYASSLDPSLRHYLSTTDPSTKYSSSSSFNDTTFRFNNGATEFENRIASGGLGLGLGGYNGYAGGGPPPSSTGSGYDTAAAAAGIIKRQQTEVRSVMESEISANSSSNKEILTYESVPKLQVRKDVSKARWDEELGMFEIVEKKGGMWVNTGVIRNGKLYCFLEDTLFLVEIGALLILDSNDKKFSLKDLYEMVAEEKNGCFWESFKAFRHLKNLGYILVRHGIPWTLKSGIPSTCKCTSLQGIEKSNGVSDSEVEACKSVSNLFGDMQINELRPTFDVYLPNSRFKKSSPGDPDFVLALARDPPSKVEIEDLEKKLNGVPLKICNVEHGLVSFFSFNNIELPVLP